MEKYTLKNGIKTIIKRNKNTPRSALVLYSKINNDEKVPGIYYLLSRLFLKGTKTKSSEEIANILDENAIDLSVDKKADYIKFKLLCLNEDLKLAMEILKDIIENSTLDDFQKETVKIKGEFEADLDSAKVKAQDEYYRTIFKNHTYGTGRLEILDSLDKITKNDLLEIYNDVKFVSEKNISVVSDIEKEEIISLLETNFTGLKINSTENNRKRVETLKENVISKVKKEDANQAQIFQGWHFPSIFSQDYPAIILLNTILGSSGLSSRLFLELREKQGLAYTVRSVYEPFVLGGHFFVYIATEPKNIKTSIEGFKIEIDKIMKIVISDEELENAKNNAIGKRQFFTETNILEASLRGYYEFLELGYNFEEKLIEALKKVTKEDIMKTASKYFSQPNALCILAPEKYLDTI